MRLEDKEEFPDADIFDIDWSSLSKLEKSDIVMKHLQYVNLSRKVVTASGSYSANINTLLMMMFMTLIMSINGVENKTIVVSIIATQFAKSIFSRLFEANLFMMLNSSKEELSKFILERLNKRRND